MMALAALEALTAGVKVRCKAVEQDRHGRMVVKVYSPNGVDISRRLVLAGWALAYRRYSTDYVPAEDEAREAKRGIWRGSFIKPWPGVARVAGAAGIPKNSPDVRPQAVSGRSPQNERAKLLVP